MTINKLFKFWLYSLFMIAMHVLLATPGGTGLYLSFNTTSWLVITILISLGFWQVAKTKTIYFEKYQLLLILGVALLWLPFNYDSDFKDHVTLQLLGVTGGVLFLVSLSQFKFIVKEKNTLLWLILYAVIFQCIFSTIEFFFLEKGDWPGFDPTQHRPFGLMLHPNVMASFLATGITAALYLTAKYSKSNYRVQWGLSTIMFISSFYLMTMNSRAGYFGLALALICITPKLLQTNKTYLMRNFVVIAIAMSLAKIALMYHPVSQHQKPSNNVQVRQDIYLMSVKMIAEKPLTGFGYGNFERSYLDFHNKQRLLTPDINPPLLKLDHPHNEILYWGVEGGLAALLGLLCFSAGYLMLFRHCNWRKTMSLLALVAPIIFHSQVEFPFYNSISHWITLLILISYSAMEVKTEKLNCSLPSSLIPGVFSILIFCVFVPFLLTTLHTSSIVTRYEQDKTTKITTFNKIINPLPWRNRIEANINAHKLVLGFQNKDRNLLIDYVHWGKKRVKYSPRISIYNNMLVSLKILGEIDKYQKTLEEAKLLYPEITEWKSETLTTINDTFDKAYL